MAHKKMFQTERSQTEIPELKIAVPDSWPTVQIAPFYDVHIGHRQHDWELFKRHLDWLKNTPNIIAFNGGDMFDNLVDPKMGHQDTDNTDQFHVAEQMLKPVVEKFAFAIPGNHEDRTYRTAHLDVAELLASRLDIPYFSDYCLATISWRGNRFKLMAHHGTGASQTAGAQRNAGRKDLTWCKPDIIWTGHLHQPLTDTVKIIDYDPIQGEYYERDAVVIISPSYLKYFGSYAAKKRMAPGSRGLTVATLQDDGRIDVTIHARGRRI